MRILKLFLNLIIGALVIHSCIIAIMLIINALGLGNVSVGSVGKIDLRNYIVPLILITSTFYFYKTKQKHMLYISMIGSLSAVVNIVFIFAG